MAKKKGSCFSKHHPSKGSKVAIPAAESGGLLQISQLWGRFEGVLKVFLKIKMSGFEGIFISLSSFEWCFLLISGKCSMSFMGRFHSLWQVAFGGRRLYLNVVSSWLSLMSMTLQEKNIIQIPQRKALRHFRNHSQTLFI